MLYHIVFQIAFYLCFNRLLTFDAQKASNSNIDHWNMYSSRAMYEDCQVGNLFINFYLSCINSLCIAQAFVLSSSRDQKFQKLVDYAVHNGDEIGIIGVHPQSHVPFNFGVTASLSKDSIKNHIIFGLSITVEGKRQFEVDDKSFMDPSGSFYMANVEIVDGREESMTHEQMQAAERLSAKIPSLVKKWKELVQEKGMRNELNGLMKVRISICEFYSCFHHNSNSSIIMSFPRVLDRCHRV